MIGDALSIYHLLIACVRLLERMGADALTLIEVKKILHRGELDGCLYPSSR